MDDLLPLLRQRIQREDIRSSGGVNGAITPWSELPPPATLEQIESTERRLKMALPAPLRRLYLELANGGFGPGNGVCGVEGGALDDGATIAGRYELMIEPDANDPRWLWPRELVPICPLGCGISACINCSDDTGRIVMFDPNWHKDGEPWDHAFTPLSPSLQQWLEEWLRGEDSLGLIAMRPAVDSA